MKTATITDVKQDGLKLSGKYIYDIDGHSPEEGRRPPYTITGLCPGLEYIQLGMSYQAAGRSIEENSKSFEKSSQKDIFSIATHEMDVAKEIARKGDISKSLMILRCRLFALSPLPHPSRVSQWKKYLFATISRTICYSPLLISPRLDNSSPIECIPSRGTNPLLCTAAFCPLRGCGHRCRKYISRLISGRPALHPLWSRFSWEYPGYS